MNQNLDEASLEAAIVAINRAITPSFLYRVWCRIAHWKHHSWHPYGIHHYDCICFKCGRRWDEWE